MQWGGFVSDSNANYTVYFPITYTTTKYSIASIDQTHSSSNGHIGVITRELACFSGKRSEAGKFQLWFSIGF